MPNHTYVRVSTLPVACQTAFDWHERAGALERLVPPWENVEVRSRHGGISDGDRVEFVMRVGLIPATWLADHFDYQRGRQFCDRQLKGPFSFWVHRHGFTANSDGRCLLEDRVDYALPLGWIGHLIAARFVKNRIDRMFAYRHRVTTDDLAAHDQFHPRPTMKILISGASGLVGTQLSAFLSGGGHEVVRLVRREPVENEIRWDPVGGTLNSGALEGFDAVIHLAGENIADGRWTAAKKRRIRDSRVDTTRLLCQTLAGLQRPPKTLISASAIGYYGDRGDQDLDEDSPAGSGFLPDVCQQWEAATAPAEDAGIRVVRMRFGMVLSPRGGALKQMLLPFRLGAGGRIGSGRQYWSWISIDDLLGVILNALMTESLSGAVNAVAPKAVTNAEFTKVLGRVLKRPTLLPMPGFAARAALGPMADDLLLASARVVPRKLTQSGYRFRHASLESALRHLLGRS